MLPQRIVSTFFLVLFAAVSFHAIAFQDTVTVTFRKAFTSQGQTIPSAWINPQFGKLVQFPGLPERMVDENTTIRFTFESDSNYGTLYLLIKNKQGSHFNSTNPGNQVTPYEEYLRVPIDLGLVNQSPTLHTIRIGDYIVDSNIEWGQSVYFGFFSEFGHGSVTDAFCNNTQAGAVYYGIPLPSPGFNLELLYDKGAHPDLPDADLGEGVNSHGFTNLGTLGTSHILHGALSKYYYELKDNVTPPADPLALADRIWELYSLNGTALTFVKTLPGTGNQNEQAGFEVPENTTNIGKKYLVLCRTVDALGNPNMEQPTTTTDPNLTTNAWFFEVGKDVTLNPSNCLWVSYEALLNGGPSGNYSTPICGLDLGVDGYYRFMLTGPDINANAGTNDRFDLSVSQDGIVGTEIGNTPSAASNVANWPWFYVGFSGNFPVSPSWRYTSAYGTTVYKKAPTIFFDNTSSTNFNPQILEFDWDGFPTALLENEPLHLDYGVTSNGDYPQMYATFWLYDPADPTNHHKILKPFNGGVNSSLVSLVGGSIQNLDQMVIPAAATAWNLPPGSRLRVRMKAIWAKNGSLSVGGDNFLNQFSAVSGTDPQRLYRYEESSDWLLVTPEPGHFTFLSPEGSGQVNVTHGNVDLTFEEEHTGNPDATLEWRWETEDGQYLWIDGTWQAASSHVDRWIALGTGSYGTGTDTFTSRWHWLPQISVIQPKSLDDQFFLFDPFDPLTGTTSLVDAFFSPGGITTPLEGLRIKVSVRMSFEGRTETLSQMVDLSLLQPEPGIEAFKFELAQDGQTPVCNNDTGWLEASEVHGRLGSLPRMRFSLTTTGSQTVPITLRIEKKQPNNTWLQVSCHTLETAFVTDHCFNTPNLGENLERWWVVDSNSSFFSALASAGAGELQVRLTTQSCGNDAQGDAVVRFVLNPEESFALRTHYRDHIGSSSISRAYTPTLANRVSNTASLNLTLGGTALVLYAEAPEWTHYEPFGKTWHNVASEPDPRYTDHEFDMQTGFNYMKGRYQLANFAKFNRPDPMRDWDWENPSSINLYQYVRNNPIDSWDPFGLIIDDSDAINDEEYGEAYIKYKERLLSTEEGRELWEKLDNDEAVITIKFYEFKDKDTVGLAGNYIFNEEGDKLLSADILLSGKTLNSDSIRKPNKGFYEFGGTLTKAEDIKLYTIGHEMGHVKEKLNPDGARDKWEQLRDEDILVKYRAEVGLQEYARQMFSGTSERAKEMKRLAIKHDEYKFKTESYADTIGKTILRAYWRKIGKQID